MNLNQKIQSRHGANPQQKTPVASIFVNAQYCNVARCNAVPLPASPDPDGSTGSFMNKPEFQTFNQIIVDEDECYASNSLWINGKVLIPKGFPKTRKKIETAGYETIVIDVSEFRKVDGGMCCLSLRF